MLHLALYQPEIPHNTGNLIRLCANAGMVLHLIGPLGFAWDDRRLRRAGLDYHELAAVHRYDSYDHFVVDTGDRRLLAFSTRGERPYHQVRYQDEDRLLFGPETRGLPAALLTSLPPQNVLRLPMAPQSRSLNLSNAAAIAAYEAWRQLGFADLSPAATAIPPAT